MDIIIKFEIEWWNYCQGLLLPYIFRDLSITWGRKRSETVGPFREDEEFNVNGYIFMTETLGTQENPKFELHIRSNMVQVGWGRGNGERWLTKWTESSSPGYWWHVYSLQVYRYSHTPQEGTQWISFLYLRSFPSTFTWNTESCGGAFCIIH